MQRDDPTGLVTHLDDPLGVGEQLDDRLGQRGHDRKQEVRGSGRGILPAQAFVQRNRLGVIEGTDPQPAQGGDIRLDDEQARAWLRTTNDLRLALGTRLDITAETEPPDDPSGDDASQLTVYYWLTAVQGSLVDAIAAGRGARR